MAEFAKKIDTCLANIEHYWPQYHIDGTRNVWILKPGAKSRGRGERDRLPVQKLYRRFRHSRSRSFGRDLEVVVIDVGRRSKIRRTEIHRTSVAHSQDEIRHPPMVSHHRLQSIDHLDVQGLLSTLLHRAFQPGHARAERALV